MISRTQIRYMANSSSYSRGAELYAAGKVLDMDVKNMGASDEIVASVKGSGRNIYEVDVSIDTENDEIDTCYCECRAYAEYGGLVNIVWRFFCNIMIMKMIGIVMIMDNK